MLLQKNVPLPAKGQRITKIGLRNEVTQAPSTSVVGIYKATYFVTRIKMAFVVDVITICPVLERPCIESICVGRRVARVMTSVIQARSVVEYISENSSNTLVLIAFICEAFVACID